MARKEKRDRYEPSDREVPGWVVPRAEVDALPPCAHCGERFRLDGAGGVAGGLVIFDEGTTKRYYHGYPERPGALDCYRRAERAGFPQP